MSSLVFPLHDPDKIQTHFLSASLPLLKEHFQNAFVSLTPETRSRNPDVLALLAQEPFFITNENETHSGIGDHFVSGFRNAVRNSDPDHIFHLCTLDRLAFAVLTDHRESFLTDVLEANAENLPLLFTRSEKAWATHPRNYQAAEAMVTEAGRVLFGKPLDFTWCHLTLTARQLSDALPHLTARDLVVFTQLVLHLENVTSKAVDWLAWEDPFILGKDPEAYRYEREHDPAELEKRMGYVVPSIQYLFETFANV